MQHNSPPGFVRPILFLLFFISGFCGLLYQVIWTRLAFASFGIITPVLSVVLSVFMLGLALGSVAGGKWISGLTGKTRLSAIYFYALTEFLIGVGAYAVPKLFAFGGHLLLAAGQMNSLTYLFYSACVLALSILPWCFFMGTTYPFMMAYIRENKSHDPQTFSFLYVANVLGAMAGTFLTAIVFIEMFGFQSTLHIAATGNVCIALTSVWLGLKLKATPGSADISTPTTATETATPAAQRPQIPLLRWILFSTGFCAMAMEVVWTRAFIPVLKTQVYSFALIVFTYLGATFAGSLWYRHHLKKNAVWPVDKLMAVLIVAVFLPIVINDPRLVTMGWLYNRTFSSVILILAAICPFCAALGYLTPGLIDDYAGDDPKRAGSAYAINVSGCILGPLFASYFLLPHMSERFALVILGLPFFIFFLAGWESLPSPLRTISSLAAGLVLFSSLFISQDFESLVASHSRREEIRRDYAASVVSMDETNGNRLLLANGIGMTSLTPITKYMVHMPLAFHGGNPQSALIICFGMGTSFRAALSWGLDTTAVELIPDVPKAFGFYHADAAEVLQNPKGRIVIDDGRRFLERTTEKYDLVVVDPPPPVETAGSSLLYSTGFYALVKQHLKPHGIIQAWFPGGDATTCEAIVNSVATAFPNVRCFVSEQGWGLHILASMDPIENLTAAQLAAQMPPAAKKDLLEWASTTNTPAYLNIVLTNEVPVVDIVPKNSNVQITDDDPVNEYFLLRRAGLF